MPRILKGLTKEFAILVVVLLIVLIVGISQVACKPASVAKSEMLFDSIPDFDGEVSKLKAGYGTVVVRAIDRELGIVCYHTGTIPVCMEIPKEHK